MWYRCSESVRGETTDGPPFVAVGVLSSTKWHSFFSLPSQTEVLSPSSPASPFRKTSSTVTSTRTPLLSETHPLSEDSPRLCLGKPSSYRVAPRSLVARTSGSGLTERREDGVDRDSLRDAMKGGLQVLDDRGLKRVLDVDMPV